GTGMRAKSSQHACVQPAAVTIEQLQQLIVRQTAFTRAYGFLVTAASDGACSLSVPYLPHFERPGGIVSGQVFMLAADVAMWLAVKTLRGLDDPSVTGHMTTDFVQSVRAEPFTCKATVRKLGRRTAFGTAECLSLNG